MRFHSFLLYRIALGLSFNGYMVVYRWSASFYRYNRWNLRQDQQVYSRKKSLFFCFGTQRIHVHRTVEEREGGSAENHIAEVQCMRAGKPVLPRGFVPLYFVPPGCSAEIGVVDYSSARKSVGRSLRKRFGMYAHIHPVPVRAHILMLFLAGRTHRGSARYQSGCKSRVVREWIGLSPSAQHRACPTQRRCLDSTPHHYYRRHMRMVCKHSVCAWDQQLSYNHLKTLTDGKSCSPPRYSRTHAPPLCVW